ncbi:MAG: glycosyltransferase family 4 protein [Defluviitaleaceae bacterium]|nr:glycosyltransferase family 4 protein [Defluviitaleaceae bacterium]
MDKKYKILHVISDTNIGGAGRVLLVFLANFNRELFDVSVVLPKGSLLLPEIQKLGIRTIEFDGIADKSLALGAIKGLKNLYKEENPDIIHSHASLSARIAAKMAKIKVVHTRHSVYTSQSTSMQQSYKKKFPYRHIAGALNNYLSDIIIAASPAAKISLMETGTKQRKTVIIYNAIDGLTAISEQDKRAYRHKYGIADDDFVCCMIARIEKVKGHSYVLKAAQMVQWEDPKVKFLLVGTGSEEAAMKKLAQVMELNNVIFTGFVPDVSEILNISHVQINASFSEATSLALLEGLSLGMPAIATDVGGNPFVINDGVNGVLFESKDYAALYKAIMDLKGNTAEYEHLSKRAKEIFNERFTASVHTQKVEDVYRKLLGVGQEAAGNTTE